jgi:predicted ATPase
VQLKRIETISNFRSIVEIGPLELDRINLFVGPNNSGKSSILQAVLALQQNFEIGPGHIRLGQTDATIRHTLAGSNFLAWGKFARGERVRVAVDIPRVGTESISISRAGSQFEVSRIEGSEPNHLIVPYLSRRRPEHFSEDVRLENATNVYPGMRFLAAKLTRVAQPSHPRYQPYADACREILGVVITAVPSLNGQLPGAFVGTSDYIPLADMGAGVAQVVGLLVDLALADEKIFVVEEPENDLHPAALRALLALLAEAAKRNQFLVSTHSNLVLRQLGSQPNTRIYQVEADQYGAWPPETKVTEVAPEPEARSRLLIQLGYELRDFEFFDGWLFLEEASAEGVIRDFLIPWFTPSLAGRVRTVSTRGASRIGPTFGDFNRLVLFTHLETRYQNRAWVLIDGDEEGQRIVSSLRETYGSTWSPEHFQTLSEGCFEGYYPENFQERVEEVLGQGDRRRRQEGKKALLGEVREWIQEDPNQAKNAFAESAAEVIQVLREIETTLGSA